MTRMSMVKALNSGLRLALENDPKVVQIGRAHV